MLEAGKGPEEGRPVATLECVRVHDKRPDPRERHETIREIPNEGEWLVERDAVPITVPAVWVAEERKACDAKDSRAVWRVCL